MRAINSSQPESQGQGDLYSFRNQFLLIRRRLPLKRRAGHCKQFASGVAHQAPLHRSHEVQYGSTHAAGEAMKDLAGQIRVEGLLPVAVVERAVATVLIFATTPKFDTIIPKQ
jgi:hypothetical protein